MRASLKIITAALMLAGAAPTLVAQTPPAPIVRVEGLRRISCSRPHHPGCSVPAVPNVGYVVGDRAVLVIDTGLGPPNGAAVYEVAERNWLARSRSILSPPTFTPSTTSARSLFRPRPR